MKRIIVFLLLIPALCFCQKHKITNQDKVWVNGILNITEGGTDEKAINQVLNIPDSITYPREEVAGVGTVISPYATYYYKNISLTKNEAYFSLDLIDFSKGTKDFFVLFDDQKLNASTDIDSVRSHFMVNTFLDSLNTEDKYIDGKMIKEIELDNTTGNPHYCTWVFYFYHRKLLMMSHMCYSS